MSPKRIFSSMSTQSSSSRRFFIDIMRPEGKSPGAVADEVGMIVRNTEIVELLLPTGQPQRRDRYALTEV
jgi:hypothetical protein